MKKWMLFSIILLIIGFSRITIAETSKENLELVGSIKNIEIIKTLYFGSGEPSTTHERYYFTKEGRLNRKIVYRAIGGDLDFYYDEKERNSYQFIDGKKTYQIEYDDVNKSFSYTNFSDPTQNRIGKLNAFGLVEAKGLTYDERGNLIRQIPYDGDHPNGGSAYTYNEENKKISWRAIYNLKEQKDSEIEYLYNDVGWLSKTIYIGESPFFLEVGNLRYEYTKIDSSGNWLERTGYTKSGEILSTEKRDIIYYEE